MPDSPHTSAPMVMQGRALALKNTCQNASGTSVEKHLSWSPDIHPQRVGCHVLNVKQDEYQVRGPYGATRRVNDLVLQEANIFEYELHGPYGEFDIKTGQIKEYDFEEYLKKKYDSVFPRQWRGQIYY